MKRLLRGVGLVVLMSVTALIAGTVVPRPPWTDSRSPDAAPKREILLLSNAIHTDIAIPVDPDLLLRFGFLSAGGLAIDQPGVRYLVFGWGGRAFYIETPEWSQLKPLPVLKALTVDRSVMHIERAGGIDRAHPAVTPLAMDNAGYQRLLQFIEASFAKQGDMPVAIPGAAYGQNDIFYEANGRFNALLGCNTWTSAALRQAGLATGWWNPLPATLSVSLALHNDLPDR
ncbi:urease-associated protein [Pararhizobium antarcticum]|uniref:Urease-associated protein n=2 Tax=Pararhizobium antarcticum TaxID=1798805 RepID=A0A657LYD7_9HYPH|nr:TIGR02117 family protein [Pararhizobium antarcticum]OJF91122.1 urease-associated protein [Rhizobium sp. 58]OJG00049.1 urease-associated protein [Pararhizobium antarcticum]